MKKMKPLALILSLMLLVTSCDNLQDSVNPINSNEEERSPSIVDDAKVGDDKEASGGITIERAEFVRQQIPFDDMTAGEINEDDVSQEYDRLNTAFKEAKTANEQAEVMIEEDSLSRKLLIAYSLSSIKYDLNQGDSELSEKYLEMVDITQNTSVKSVEFARQVVESEYRPQLEERFGKVYFKLMDMLVETYDDEMAELNKQEKRLVVEYNEYRANPVIVEDELNVKRGKSTIISMLLSEDESKVKKGRELYSEYWRLENERTMNVYMQLLEIRQKCAELAGYENYYEYFYADKDISGYGTEEIEKFDDYVYKYIVPIYKGMKEETAELYGFESIPFDQEYLIFLSGYYYSERSELDSDEKLMEATLDVIRSIHPDISVVVDEMTDLGLVNVLPSSTKKGGGYSTFLYEYNQPFIYSDRMDVNTLIHEFGHSANFYYTGDVELVSQKAFDTAYLEIHSSSLEILAMDKFEEIYGETSDIAISSWFYDMLEEIIITALFDEFQRYIYTEPDVTAEQINAKYAELCEKYKGETDNLGVESLDKGYDWVYSSHAFENPFYSVQYAVATGVSLQFYDLMQENYDEAVQKYVDFIKLDSSYNIVSALSEVGLEDIFEEETVAEMAITLEQGLSMGSSMIEILG